MIDVYRVCHNVLIFYTSLLRASISSLSLLSLAALASRWYSSNTLRSFLKEMYMNTQWWAWGRHDGVECHSEV